MVDIRETVKKVFIYGLISAGAIYLGYSHYKNSKNDEPRPPRSLDKKIETNSLKDFFKIPENYNKR